MQATSALTLAIRFGAECMCYFGKCGPCADEDRVVSCCQADVFLQMTDD
jgi:hypothetical protein